MYLEEYHGFEPKNCAYFSVVNVYNKCAYNALSNILTSALDHQVTYLLYNTDPNHPSAEITPTSPIAVRRWCTLQNCCYLFACIGLRVYFIVYFVMKKPEGFLSIHLRHCHLPMCPQHLPIHILFPINAAIINRF